MKSGVEVADIFRRYGGAYRAAHGSEMPRRQHRVMDAIAMCRTAALGGHVDECDACGAIRISYNSCRNRHCPKCQCLEKERWLEARERELLPTQYFHMVFTIPEDLRPLALRNQQVVYRMLFRTVSETLKELAGDPNHLGAKIGFITILHTWTQTLLDHPHVHCLIPGGGLSPDGSRWISSNQDFFLPVQVLSRKFRGKFLYYLQGAYKTGELVFPGSIAALEKTSPFCQLVSELYAQEWVVFCKPPFQKPEAVIAYLARYTHRVAMTNDRLVQVDNDQVLFTYRDRADNDTLKYMSLDACEFIRRFLLHVLPDNFVKIRYYGILSNRNRKETLLLCQELFAVPGKPRESEDEKESWEDLLFRMTGIDPRICSACGTGHMVLRETLQPIRRRYPP